MPYSFLPQSIMGREPKHLLYLRMLLITSLAHTALGCSVGMYLDATSTCVQCAAGTYAPVTGLTACATCPLGQYTDIIGASACKQCESCNKTGEFRMKCNAESAGKCYSNSTEPYFVQSCMDGDYLCYDASLVCDPLCNSNGNLNIKCAPGYYLSSINSVQIGHIVWQCTPCLNNANSKYNTMPYNAYYFDTSAFIEDNTCPWRCNSGYYQDYSFCLPSADCDNPANAKAYSSLNHCYPGQEGGCGLNQIYQGDSAQILISVGYKATPFSLYSIKSGQLFKSLGYKLQFLDESSIFYGGNDPYDNNNFIFQNPIIAQKSGTNTTQIVFDSVYHTIHTFDPITGVKRFVAGRNKFQNLTDTSAYDGVGANAKFKLDVIDVIATSNDNKISLLIDNQVLKMVDMSTGVVTSLVGRDGYYSGPSLDGKGTDATLFFPKAISISPDKSFALIADISIRYLNISTKTISNFAGKPAWYGSRDGVGSEAFMFYPRGIAISNSGKFAISADCAAPEFASWVGNGGFPGLRHINISSQYAYKMAGSRDYTGVIKDGYGLDAWLSCPLYLTITPDDSTVYFYDYFADHNSIDAHVAALRKLNLATTEVVTLTRFSQYEQINSMSNVFLQSTPKCTDCPLGNFIVKDAINTQCVPCPVGKFSAVLSSECQTCPVGTFGNTTGLSACFSCAKGTFGNATGLTTPCTGCAKGTFANATGSSLCADCPPGTYADVQGSAACQTCQTCPTNGYFKSGCGGATAGVCTVCVISLNMQ